MITCPICNKPLHKNINQHEGNWYDCNKGCHSTFTEETAEKMIWENPYFITKRDIHDKFIRRVEETSRCLIEGFDGQAQDCIEASISMAIVHTKLIDALSAKMLEESQEEESNAADKITT